MNRRLILIMLLSLSIFSLSANITGPRYRLEGSVGVFDSNKSLDQGRKTFSSITLGLLPEWKVDLDKRFDITFGPKIGANVSYYNTTNKYVIEPKIILSMETDINYRLKEDIKLYGGIEIGLGLRLSRDNNKNKFIFETVGNVLLGIKIRDRYNVAVHVGNGKGILGIEAGYTF
ncbi:hypothetical protein KX935_02675 [Streptobacillus moniliformis]|uniref:hypothetical protein n=1 Tax=Streptobacillus moniliformis TaxID=34105 RepID=UPI0007E3A0C2|nr:hypothetical protein [Streptobacillus moniliformis]QXW66156.1 hypothetical protein KX935_02675 [Streptobacillus moniliformis]